MHKQEDMKETRTELGEANLKKKKKSTRLMHRKKNFKEKKKKFTLKLK